MYEAFKSYLLMQNKGTEWVVRFNMQNTSSGKPICKQELISRAKLTEPEKHDLIISHKVNTGIKASV